MQALTSHRFLPTMRASLPLLCRSIYVGSQNETKRDVIPKTATRSTRKDIGQLEGQGAVPFTSILSLRGISAGAEQQHAVPAYSVIHPARFACQSHRLREADGVLPDNAAEGSCAKARGAVRIFADFRSHPPTVLAFAFQFLSYITSSTFDWHCAHTSGYRSSRLARYPASRASSISSA